MIRLATALACFLASAAAFGQVMGTTPVGTFITATPSSVSYQTPVTLTITATYAPVGSPPPYPPSGANLSCTGSGGSTFSTLLTTDASGMATYVTPITLAPGTYTFTCTVTGPYPFSQYLFPGTATFTVGSTNGCTSATDSTYIDTDNNPDFITWAFEIDATPASSNQDPPSMETGYGTEDDTGTQDCEDDEIYITANSPTEMYLGWRPQGNTQAYATWNITSYYFAPGEPCDYGDCLNRQPGESMMQPPQTVSYTANCN